MRTERLQQAVQQTLGTTILQLLNAQEEAVHFAEQLEEERGRREKAYTLLSQCISSAQVPDVAAILDADPQFAAWYRASSHPGAADAAA